ncbi:hypothetical protein [Gaoshiqia sediminis]|uniref:Uncharacterized protein n=1 Tax=Gaoshiqia sediminis TaxID=2986998 RepID=A0AA41YAR8_9BACT|nr:hypothetical protein [Gaoshiqia sediminis]MCW0481167.1 hypothetical protein [Gaoshiqia sediminis]
MGYSYTFTCQSCHHRQKLYEGWGFMVHDQPAKDYLLSQPVSLHYRTHQKIVKLSQQYPDLELKMEYRIYRCRHCLQISDKLFVQLISDGKVLHKTRFRCSNCQTSLKHTNILRLKYAICPKCKSQQFKKEKELVLWN